MIALPRLITLGILASCLVHAAEFKSNWEGRNDAPWLGPDYWANPMEDWKVADGKIECIRTGGDRNVQLLTHSLAKNSSA